jgi:hypothetical protein
VRFGRRRTQFLTENSIGTSTSKEDLHVKKSHLKELNVKSSQALLTLQRPQPSPAAMRASGYRLSATGQSVASALCSRANAARI